MLWVMRFVVMLTNVTIVNYPHVTQGAVVLEASFGYGGRRAVDPSGPVLRERKAHGLREAHPENFAADSSLPS